MIYKTAEKWDGCYTHSVYYGTDACSDLFRGLAELISDLTLNHLGLHARFWTEVSVCIKEAVQTRLASNKRARAVLVHKDRTLGHGIPEELVWNFTRLRPAMLLRVLWQ